jgi:hypothetical protein
MAAEANTPAAIEMKMDKKRLRMSSPFDENRIERRSLRQRLIF